MGLFIIFNPFALTTFLTLGLGVWLILSGTFKLNYAFDLKRYKEEYWALALTVAIIYVIFGAILIFNPLQTSLLISELIGLFVIGYGALNLLENILFKKNINTIIKIVRRK